MKALITRDHDGQFDSWAEGSPPVWHARTESWHCGKRAVIEENVPPSDIPEQYRDRPGGEEGWPVPVRLVIESNEP